MPPMNSRSLAVSVSCLMSQSLLLLLLFPPAANSPGIHRFQKCILPLMHLVSASDIVAAAAFLSVSSRKRKRINYPEDEADRGSGIPHTPDSFTKFFGMKSSTFEWLCGLLDPLLDCRDPVEAPLNLPAETRLGIGLFRLATGADFPEISSRFGVSEDDSRFCVKQLCRVLCTNYRFWVGLPSQSELESVAARFQSLTGLPNCCGIIGCARFQSEELSVAAQIVVDSSSRILSIVAGFHGQKSDNLILRSSSLYNDITQGSKLNSPSLPLYFLGIGDYPLLPWLMLPFPDPKPESEEENFNRRLHRTRIPWLKADRSLRKWGILNGENGIPERKAFVACIGACSILHNMLLMREDYSSFSEEDDDDHIELYKPASEDHAAVLIRRALCSKVSTSTP